MPPVLIVNMPLANLRWPNLGPSLLKAALMREGIGCEIAYFNFDLAEQIGLDDYDWIGDHFGFVLGGERLFAKHYFGDRLPDDESYFRTVLLQEDAALADEDRRAYERLADCVEPFLDRCMAAVDWSAYAVVGFTSTFQQNMSSLCLARRIKALHPEIRIAMGGAACEGEMGRELLRQFPEVDYVFLGEADVTFPHVVRQILSGGPVELPSGVVARSGEGTPRRAFATEMDDLPYPDFDDYFARWKASPLREQIEPLFLFETSRGCWWGQKHHCVFCGLNGGTMAFRSKSAPRAMTELRYLIDRYDVHRACSSDNILDHRYFATLLPMLRDAGLDLTFEYELKTNLAREQVRLLVDAGLGAAQLGIETFVSSLLRRMNKGVTAVQNLQTLKWFSETGIEVKWNLLYGFPGEDPADYEALARILPSLYHLVPPQAAGRVRADRFSPYFEDPAAYGIARLRPNRSFPFVYPFPDESLTRLAYYFEFDHADGRDPRAYTHDLLETVAQWQSLAGTVSFSQVERPDGVLLLHDTRPMAKAFQHRLSGVDREIYLFCDTGRTLAKIVEFVAERSGRTIEPGKIERQLSEWVGDGLMARVDERYLSLAMRGSGG
jgi:ribosomal peptide maturation radical SAM protein 1